MSDYHRDTDEVTDDDFYRRGTEGGFIVVLRHDDVSKFMAAVADIESYADYAGQGHMDNVTANAVGELSRIASIVDGQVCAQ